MRITSHGAAGEVTGSCHLLEAGGKRVLVDCGQFQGGDHSYARSAEAFPFDPKSIDAVVLTHGHLDHIGRLPLLVKAGFNGPIFATGETREIGRLILMDAAHVMYEEYGHRKRKAARQGGEIPPPPYAVDDALLAVDRFAPPVAYDSPHALSDGLSLTLRNAGHILGSAFLEFEERQNGTARRVTFSGDLGYRGREVMPDPADCHPCDAIVSEATYGDRPHRPVEESRLEFVAAVKQAMERGGNVVIPSFALERSQDVLFYLHQMWDAGEIGANCRIFLDSPLAISITEAYERHLRSLNPRLLASLDRGEDPFEFPGVEFTPSAEDSRAINRFPSGSIIVAGSGMANGGRVLHHLRHNLWRPDCSVIFVGYQAIGTPGRAIVDGARSIHIFGEEVAIRARVYTINGMSAHADQRGIVDWLRGSGDAEVLLVHGEPTGLDKMATIVRDELHRKVTVVKPETAYDV
jgi:metallo-beta-lactamase family protein